MSLLGSSQTFIGTLTTIVVLCIILDNSGNFLYNFLSNLSENTKKITNEIEKEFSGFSAKYGIKSIERRFKSSLRYYSKFKGVDDYLRRKELEFNVRSTFFAFDYVKHYFIPIQNKITGIQNCKEQTYSPLFVFGYCIILFLSDELSSYFPSLFNFLVYFTVLFTSISFIFLTTLWIKFYNEAKCINQVYESRNYLNFNSYLKKGTYLYLISLVFFLLLAFNTYTFCKICPQNEWGMAISFFMFILCLMAYISTAIEHSSFNKAYGKYGYAFLFYHFCAILISSLILAFINCITLLFLQYTIDNDILICLKLEIILFIIIFGLIAPFAFPFKGLKYLEKYAKKCNEDATLKLKQDNQFWETWLAQFRIMAQDIKGEKIQE